MSLGEAYFLLYISYVSDWNFLGWMLLKRPRILDSSRSFSSYAFVPVYIILKLRQRKNQEDPIRDTEAKFLLRLPALNMPVLGLIGENDGCFYPPLFRFVHSDAGGAQKLFKSYNACKTIKGAGHFSFIEKPEEIAETLCELFQQAQGSDRSSL